MVDNSKNLKYTYGFCYVDGVPVSSDATQELVERIAFVRPTHYGGFWDVTPDLASKDTAYTDLPLGVHTDTTYFTDSVGLQLFHLLEHKGDGGSTILVDGFKAARILRDEHPDSYRILSNVRIPSHSSGNGGVSIQPFAPFPVLNHHPVDGELVQIRWNNDDRATMDNWVESEEVDRFYEATRHWVEILRRRDVEYCKQLVPGRALSECINFFHAYLYTYVLLILQYLITGEYCMGELASQDYGGCVVRMVWTSSLV